MTKSKWLTPSEMRAWRGFIEVVGRLNIDLEADLARHRLTMGDYQVLVYLSENEDHSMRMCDLADMLNLSPSGLTRRLDGLVKHGLVSRERNDADRRVMMAVLTQKGMDKLVSTAPHHVASVRRNLIDRLDDRQIRQLGQIFESLRRRD
ncbi:MAG: MarR family winged helix-turn-helix transcriptional regulator [Actinomycetota bacterium]